MDLATSNWHLAWIISSIDNKEASFAIWKKANLYVQFLIVSNFKRMSLHYVHIGMSMFS